MLKIIPNNNFREYVFCKEFLNNADNEQSVYYIIPSNTNTKKIKLDNIMYNFDADGISNFYNFAKTSQLSNFLLSEEIPDYSSTELVHSIVGNNFKELVIESNNDVLILFYNSISGSNSLLYESTIQEINEVANCYINNQNLKFYKFNAISNDIYDNNLIDSRIKNNYQIVFYSKITNKKIPIFFDNNGENLDITRQNILDFIKKFAYYPLGDCNFS